MPPDFVYLASGSPRRRELLDQIGVRFQVLAAAVDERPGEREAAGHYVARLAGDKARAGWPARTHDAPVLAADTAVTVDGRILGKPVDREDAERMLAALSDRTHEVWTAVALQTSHGLRERVSRSTVTFRRIDPAEMRAYWNTGEPRDKAGGYAIQGLAAVFVAALSGSYSGVMGLPLFETAELLREAGIAAWHQADAR